MDVVAAVLLWLGMWVLGELAGDAGNWLISRALRPFAPLWSAFVRSLNGWMVLMLWGVAFAAVTFFEHVTEQPDASDGVRMLALAAFMAAPVIAIVVTMVWRAKRDREADAYAAIAPRLTLTEGPCNELDETGTAAASS
jgi:hypothetical protein